MTKKEPRPLLDDLLGAIEPHANRGAAAPSEARLYIRGNFDAIATARDRGVAWPQIAGALEQAGVTAADGSPLEWRTVAGLFHAERYSRGGQKQRRKPKPAQPLAQAREGTRTTPAPVKPALHEIVDDSDDDQPESEFGPISGYRTYKPKE
jgi:hypothetical protein